MVHIIGSQLIDIAEGVLEGIFADPYAGGELVAVEVTKRCCIGVVVTIGGGVFCRHGLMKG